jgi:hypothetical protein
MTKFPIGGNGIGIDRAELDLWIAYMKATQGKRKEIPPWEVKEDNLPSEFDTPNGHEMNHKKRSSHYSRARGITQFQKIIKKITSKKSE